MKPELLFLILFLFGFVLYCFLGNNPGFYKKIEGMNTVETSSNGSNGSNGSNASNGSDASNGSNNSYENYNHYNGTSIATKYYGPNGEVVVINSPSSITVINTSGTSVEYKSSVSSSSGSTNIEAITFMGPNGETATFVSGSNGGKAVKITDTNGNSVLYGDKPSSSGSSSFMNNNPLTSYYGSTGNAVPNNSAYAYVSPSSSTSSSSEYGQMYNQSPQSSQLPQSPQSPQSYDYSSSLPPGIPKSQILPGQQDLYILKSQVVPPVCPACNPVIIYKDKECQACPACARCPEPNFECKKVPNYNAINNEYLPTPVLNSFSSFGM